MKIKLYLTTVRPYVLDPLSYFNFDLAYTMNKQIIFLRSPFSKFRHGSKFSRHSKSRLIAYSCTGHRWAEHRYVELALWIHFSNYLVGKGETIRTR